MLDESEFSKVSELHSLGIREVQNYRQRTGDNLQTALQHHQFRPLLDWYRELTGYEETNPNAIYHHRLSLYGPPCVDCGKPFRTPQARFCGECGSPGNQR